ncbi:fibronectin type III domain-containing protein 11-like isoform X6 [Hoplias malabaricus]|uniref:fibronectin type III domain-containing protein 11-like isoform X6 n=1 Tax=Hoplias malabaricus TaxID=27720 RepID=UPI0034618CBF
MFGFYGDAAPTASWSRHISCIKTMPKEQLVDPWMFQRMRKVANNQAAAEFEDALVLHRFHIKYPLYSVSSCTVIPEMEMALSIKTPVIFEGNKCFATSDSIVLHWNVADQHKPGEQFEIHYKLIHPNNEAESKQMWKLTCPSYCLQINGLMPDRFYECAVKRVDTSFLVYGLWNDAIVLRTVLGTVENSEANRV